jgi:hypothetical protein
VEELNGGVFNGGESRTLDYCEQGNTFSSGDATLTQDQANKIQRNYQAIRIIKSLLTSEEYDKVDGLKSSKEVWDTLFINHEGTKQVRDDEP